MIGKILCYFGYHKWDLLVVRYTRNSGKPLSKTYRCIRCARTKKQEEKLAMIR